MSTLRKWVNKVLPASLALSEVKLREAAGVTVNDDEEGWTRLSGDSKRDLSPLSQSRMRETAVYLWDNNMLANRIVELQLAYLLAEGVMLKPKVDKYAEALTRFWNDPINSLDIKLPKKVRELALFGEQVWPTFVNEVNGHVRLGYVDPDNIAQVVLDPDNREQPIGIVTTKDRQGRYKKYRVIVNGPEDVFTERTQRIRETDFADGECFYFTINDLSLSRRGRSDLRALADFVDGYDQFLFGEMEGYNFKRAWMWDVKLTGASQEECEARAKKMKPPVSGSVRVHNESEEWDTTAPTLNASDASAGATLLRNHVLGGASVPPHWFGGAEDVNRSTGSEMSEPTFKIFSMRQRVIKHMLEAMGTYAIRQLIKATESGGEPEWFDERLQCEAVFAEMTTKDTTKYAAALQQVIAGAAIAVTNGHMTDETAVKLIAAIAERLGVEIDVAKELKDAKDQAAAKLAEQQVNDAFPDPGDPGDEGAAQQLAQQGQKNANAAAVA